MQNTNQNTNLEGTTKTTTNRDSIMKYEIDDKKSKSHGRVFYVSFPNKIPKEKVDVLFLFHGGGEVAYSDKSESGILNYTQYYLADCLVVSFQGQPSNNGHSWENAFPWMQKDIKNDVSFVEEVYEILKKNKTLHMKKEMNLSGKSDGAGFCFYLHQNTTSSLPISNIGICSGAHFTLNSINDMKRFQTNKTRTPNIFLIHGTSDDVMPFEGQHFENSMAKKKASYWKTIDPKMKNTYTANIESFFKFFSNKKHIKSCDFSRLVNKGKTIKSTIFKSVNNVALVKVDNQNHCWQGHKNSGPDSDSLYNKQFDATVVLCKFFNIRLQDEYSYQLETPIYYTKKVSCIQSTLSNPL